MNTQRSLAGIHAIVTGGSRGIGGAVATALAECGAKITIMARSLGDLRARAASLEQITSDVHIEQCSVADETSVERAFNGAFERFGPAGILVNNAGIAKSAGFKDTTRGLWDEMISVNLTGAYICTSKALPAMIAARQGRIINIASTAGLRGYKTMTAYCAAKHGLVGLTRSLAQETAKYGVTVNAVCPGYTDTDLVDSAIRNVMEHLDKTQEEARAMLVSLNPRGVMTTAAEVAAVVVWLSSPEARAVNGVALPVAGGEVT